MGNLQRKHNLEWLDTSKQFLRNMEELGLGDRVEAHVSTSLDAAQAYTGKPIGLLFVDGRHTEEAVYEDGAAWSAHLAPQPSWFSTTSRGRASSGNDAVGRRRQGAGHRRPCGKVGVCGPSAGWPARVQAIARSV